MVFEPQSCGSVFSLKWNKRNAPLVDEASPVDSAEFDLLISQINSTQFSIYKEAILGYIAGYIVRTISTKSSCVECHQALFHRRPPALLDHGYPTFEISHLALVNHKERGGLVKPSSSVYTIVKQAEKILSVCILSPSKINKMKLQHHIKLSLRDCVLFTEIEEHDIQNEQLNEDLHSSQLCKEIIDMFIKIRLYAYTNKFNKEILHGDKIGVRQQSTKLLIFKGI